MTAETSVGVKVTKGKLAFVGTPTVGGPNGIPGLADFTKTAILPTVTGDNDGSFGLTADFKATSAKTSSTTTTGGGSLGVSVGPIQGGGSGSVATADATTTSGSGGAVLSPMLNVHVKDAAAPTTKTKTAQVKFVKSGSKILDNAAPGILRKFYAELPKEVRDDIKAAKISILLDGHADSKGGDLSNFKLSAARTEAVLKGLQIMDPELGDKNVKRLNLGADGTKQDGKDHEEDRVVNLNVTYEEAPPTAAPAGGGSPQP